jgi:hypothetical protein
MPPDRAPHFILPTDPGYRALQRREANRARAERSVWSRGPDPAVALRREVERAVLGILATRVHLDPRRVVTWLEERGPHRGRRGYKEVDGVVLAAADHPRLLIELKCTRRLSAGRRDAERQLAFVRDRATSSWAEVPGVVVLVPSPLGATGELEPEPEHAIGLDDLPALLAPSSAAPRDSVLVVPWERAWREVRDLCPNADDLLARALTRVNEGAATFEAGLLDQAAWTCPFDGGAPRTASRGEPLTALGLALGRALAAT